MFEVTTCMNAVSIDVQGGRDCRVTSAEMPWGGETCHCGRGLLLRTSPLSDAMLFESW